MGPGSSRRATLVDIARAAGVSKSTVSLVLRNSPLVAAATRQRVETAMRSLDYVYNRGAAVLRSGRSHIIGLLLTDIANPFYSSFVSGVSEIIQKNGWVLLLADTKETTSLQSEIIARLLEHSVDGLIVCPAEHTSLADIGTIFDSRVPCLLAMRNLPGAPADYVGPNYERGMQMAVAHLASLGHRHIAFVGHVGETSSAADRRRGFEIGASAGRIVPERIDCAITRAGGRQAAAEMLSHPKVTACVCYNDQVAFGLMAGLAEAGVRVGRDVAVVGMDNLAEGESSAPPLTSISVQSAAIGRRAGDLILRRVRGARDPAETVILEPELIVRASSCPPRA